MERTPPIPFDELDGPQRDLYEKVMAIFDVKYEKKFIYKRSADGAFLGPMETLLHTPELAMPAFTMSKTIGSISNLPALALETATVAIGVHYDSQYIIYAHAVLAKDLGLTDEQVAALKEGLRPEGLDLASQLALEVANELISKKGPLSDSAWQRGVTVLGKKALLALIHYVGYYSYSCVVLNGCNVGLPLSEM